MKLIRLTGGLGNQMFIYAFYLAMKKRFPAIRLDMSEIAVYKLHNGYELKHIFGTEANKFRINKVLKKILVWCCFHKIEELDNVSYNSEYYEKHYKWPFIYYKGYFQSENFFENVIPEVRKAFTFDLSKINEKTGYCLQHIQEVKSVSIHIRRGDFVNSKNIQIYGGICTPEYYKRAIKQIEEYYPKPVYYVFSDEMEWVKNNIPLPLNTVYVSWNEGKDSWQDMLLMSTCRHNIIANSSFSWWGAWLNSNKNKIVIAPKKWLNTKDTPELVPETWISI